MESLRMTTEIAALDNDVKSLILTIRGVQVMLDRDLAMLYGVTTKRLNEPLLFYKIAYRRGKTVFRANNSREVRRFQVVFREAR